MGLIDRSRFDPIVLLSGHGPAEALLDKMGVPYEIWGPLTEPSNPFQYLRAVLSTVRWLKRQRVDLIHFNRANDWRSAEVLAASLCRIPVVTHFHTVNLDRSPSTRRASAIAAVSGYVAAHSDTQGIPAVVIHNTVDMERFTGGKDLRGTFDIDPGQTVVSFLGQIREIKGLKDFVEMSSLVLGDTVRFLIAGNCRDKRVINDTYTEDELLALISHDPRICYCGYVERVEDIYRTSDIVVVPSRWEEPFGLICIEAGAAGLPVVATRVGGMPEVIEDAVTGLLVEAGDTRSMAREVRRLLDDSALRAALGTAARAKVRREFTVKPVRELEQLYESVLVHR